MNDVIPPCGGYLVVRIDQWGYILNYDDDEVIHKETRGIDEWGVSWDSFSKAKKQLSEERSFYADPDELALLELTSEGGGAALWMKEEQIPELSRRVSRFRGCYGTWPIRALTI